MKSYCPNCGKRVKKNDVLCISCNYKFNINPEPDSALKDPEHISEKNFFAKHIEDIFITILTLLLSISVLFLVISCFK